MDKIISDKQAIHAQINDQFFDVEIKDLGVPQGSILGLVLFTYSASTLQEECFINHNSLSRYADYHFSFKVFKPIDHKFLQNMSSISKLLVPGCIRTTSKIKNRKTNFITFGTRSFLNK